MSDYTNFDAALLAHIRSGITTFTGLGCRRDLKDLARPFCSPLTEPWRVIDRRLQALRKAGRLTYDRKAGWQIAATTTQKERA